MGETMHLAVPSTGSGGLASDRSGHFGRCSVFTIAEIGDGEVKGVRLVENPPHVEGGCMRPVELLASHGVTALVVAGMGARPLAGFKSVGIDVYFEDVTPTVGGVIDLVIEGNVGVMDDRSVCGGH